MLGELGLFELNFPDTAAILKWSGHVAPPPVPAPLVPEVPDVPLHTPLLTILNDPSVCHDVAQIDINCSAGMSTDINSPAQFV